MDNLSLKVLAAKVIYDQLVSLYNRTIDGKEIYANDLDNIRKIHITLMQKWITNNK